MAHKHKGTSFEPPMPKDKDKMMSLYDDLEIKYELNTYGNLSLVYQSLFLHRSNVSFNFDRDGKFTDIDIYY
jgi:hypothetical protein